MKAKTFSLLAMVVLGSSQINFAGDAGLAKLAAANNNFFFKLLTAIASEKPGKNIFVSPYSAATALQMAANGAGGVTKTEMQTVLGTSGISTDTLNEASKTALNLLNQKNKNLTLSTANALWYRQGVKLYAGFLEENQKNFSSTIRPLNFENALAAEKEINRWASDQTHGRITDIADGMISADTDLILTNAIYFKGKWEDPFDKKLTKERPFHPAAGASKIVPMMEISKKFNYCQGSGYQAVRLPYIGGSLAMYVFLPDSGSDPVKLIKNIGGDDWQNTIVPNFSFVSGLVVLPKFKIENTFELNHSLAALGIKSAFEQGKADFSEMFSEPHFISGVRQKTFVEVGEEGTEAAAVTGVKLTKLAAARNPSPPFEMIVDRPFLFTIVDARSEMILFMGVVNEL